jgi:geranylgeranyl pyrophosphate synthase
LKIEDFFNKARADIEKRLRDRVRQYDRQGRLAHFLNGGKRLRPVLSVLAFRACGGDEKDYEKAIDLAVAIELQHTASLIHDDIIDGDSERRGRPSYHRIFGVEDALLEGHKVIVLGFKGVLNHDKDVMKTLFDVWSQALTGETEDFEAGKRNLADLIVSVDQLYFDTMLRKTASLFAGAAKLGCQESGAPKDLQNALWEYGKNIGLAYQLSDDCVDVNNGSAEPLPLAWVIKQIDDKTRKSFISAVEHEGLSAAEAFSKFNVDARSLFRKEIRRIQNKAETLARDEKIPASVFRPLLLEAPKYIVESGGGYGN